MMGDFREEMAEQRDMEIRSEACEILCTLLHNAICYMTDNNMTQEEIAEYLGCSYEMIDNIEVEDYEAIVEEDE